MPSRVRFVVSVLTLVDSSGQGQENQPPAGKEAAKESGKLPSAFDCLLGSVSCAVAHSVVCLLAEALPARRSRSRSPVRRGKSAARSRSRSRSRRRSPSSSRGRDRSVSRDRRSRSRGRSRERRFDPRDVRSFGTDRSNHRSPPRRARGYSPPGRIARDPRPQSRGAAGSGGYGGFGFGSGW